MKRIFQLISTDSDSAGLYAVDEDNNMSNDEITSTIKDAFDTASIEEEDDIIEGAEKILLKYGIFRVFCEAEVYTDKI